jgi:hypothetical protein
VLKRVWSAKRRGFVADEMRFWAVRRPLTKENVLVVGFLASKSVPIRGVRCLSYLPAAMELWVVGFAHATRATNCDDGARLRCSVASNG